MISEPESTPPPLGFRIIPCTGLDASERSFMVTIGLVINARLDWRRMETTLSNLIEHKFPRAGARLACRNGIYEFQVPEKFDSQNPPFIFTREEHSEIYHRDGRPQIPSVLTGSDPCVIPDPGLESFLQSDTCPTTLDEFVKSNGPFLHVHVNVFDDLTFLGFIAPHTALDVRGAATLLAAWTRLLGGEDMRTIPGMAWDAQPFAHFSSGSVESEVRSGWSKPGHGHAHVQPPDSDPKSVPRFVRIPKVFLDDAKQSIMAELKARGSTDYVGIADVLTAWWLKTVFSRRSLSDHTPVHIHVLKDLRDQPVFADDAPLKGPYIHNVISTMSVPPISASAIQTESLGTLALRIRRSSVAYNADPEAIRADLRWECAEANRLQVVVSRCPPGAEHVFWSDWRGAKLAELNFTGAVQGNDEMKAAARVVFVYPLLLSSTLETWGRGFMGVLMDDGDAVWMCEARGEKDWERIRQTSGVTFTDTLSLTNSWSHSISKL